MHTHTLPAAPSLRPLPPPPPPPPTHTHPFPPPPLAFEAMPPWRARQHRGCGETMPEDYRSPQMMEEEADVCEILPSETGSKTKLHLSSYQGTNAFQKIQRVGLTHVLTIGYQLYPKHPDKFQYKQIELEDSVHSDILNIIPECFAFIDESQESGGCLVHCERGRSRSATITLAYCMLREGLRLREAWERVLAARPVVSPNSGFAQQIMRLDAILASVPRPAGVDDIVRHPLFRLHLEERGRADAQDFEFFVTNPHCCIDPTTFSQTVELPCADGDLLAGVACIRCRHLLASPLNLFWVCPRLLCEGCPTPAGPEAVPSMDSMPESDDGSSVACAETFGAVAELVAGTAGELPDQPVSPGSRPLDYEILELAAQFAPVQLASGPSVESDQSARRTHHVKCPGCGSRVGLLQHTASALHCAEGLERTAPGTASARCVLPQRPPEKLLPFWCAAYLRESVAIIGVRPK
eukprot:TRINITY_DN8041_c0_g2_i11.p1 TRINITY_DN8041_c0_g2~~TRINITY_DN8041_c0_g2_i11.p1  ORF type:complete len:466 (+),score=48.23 TRINITY_DN8041_c0_g2_i11:511-1908(+)